MEPSSSASDPLKSNKIKRVKPKEALKNHNDIIQSAGEFMHTLTTDKSISLNEAAKLRLKGTPATLGAKLRVPDLDDGIEGYDNTPYHASVKAVQNHKPTLETWKAHLQNHVSALEKHPKPPKVMHALDQAKQMHKSLRAADMLLHDHVNDDPAHLQGLLSAGHKRIRKPTEDIKQRLDSVARIIQGVPHVSVDHQAVALKNHEKMMAHATHLLHGAVEAKQAVLNHQIDLRNSALPVEHKAGRNFPGLYSNLEYRGVVKDMARQREQVGKKLKEAERHAEKLAPLENKQAKEAYLIHAHLNTAHDMLKEPAEDADRVAFLNALSRGHLPTPSKDGDTYYQVEKSILQQFRKDIPKKKSAISNLLKGKKPVH